MSLKPSVYPLGGPGSLVLTMLVVFELIRAWWCPLPGILDTPRHRPRVLVVSGSTDRRAWTQNVTRNQHLFSSLHENLDYTFVGPEAAMSILGEDYEPQWLKIRLLQDMLKTLSVLWDYQFVLWMDDDIVVTNPQNFVEEMVARMSPSEDMLIAKDAGTPNVTVNSGMMLFRIGLSALQLIQDIWDMNTRKAPGGTLGTCKQQKCLHEQAAINILHDDDPSFRSVVRVVQPVEGSFNMNTFYRRSHKDRKRRLKIKYDEDPAKYRWSPGLNTCHVTGMEHSLRADMIETCLEAAEQAFMSHTPSQSLSC